LATIVMPDLPSTLYAGLGLICGLVIVYTTSPVPFFDT
jgi:hypothetical protein